MARPNNQRVLIKQDRNSNEKIFAWDDRVCGRLLGHFGCNGAIPRKLINPFYRSIEITGIDTKTLRISAILSDSRLQWFMTEHLYQRSWGVEMGVEMGVEIG